MKWLNPLELLNKEVVIIKNKVFVKLEVPEIDKTFDVYLPVNKKIGNITNLISQAVSEITNGDCIVSTEYKLYNKSTMEMYSPDMLLLNTTIRNGTVLVFIQ